MGKKWTEDEIKTLRRLYPKMANKAISEELGKSVTSINLKAVNLGLRKDQKFRAQQVADTRAAKGKR